MGIMNSSECVDCEADIPKGTFRCPACKVFFAQDQKNPVDSPHHYNTGSIECFEAMAAHSTPEDLRAYCRLNAFKYLWRCTYKGKEVEDLKKAAWYIGKSVESHESEGSGS